MRRAVQGARRQERRPDKGPDGNRIDSIPIANGVIKAGGVRIILYDLVDHEGFVAATAKYDALIVRINPGQLSQGTSEGTQYSTT